MGRMWPVIELPLVLLLALVGCGGPEFGNVHGTVTLDGEPLVGGTVQFQPDGGSPAFGVTDEKGHYKLDWSADQGGAPLGKHKVRITSFDESKPRIKERVPEKFNRHTELIREVGAGQQRFDFDLKSK
jgi:hypothetical protein